MADIKINRLVILICFLASCTASRNSLGGNYYARAKDYSYTLKLSEDGTFSLTQKYTDVNSSCDGTWKKVDDDTLLLTCSPAKFPEQIQGGYMSEREKTVEVINSRKLKIGNVYLKLTN